MYFQKKNLFYHGIMFHHFHDNKKHKKTQGSISGKSFKRIINFIGKKNILDADIFYKKFSQKKLKKKDVCLTFDDAIKSQIDVALPVLKKLKIKAFFFVYSSIFENKPDFLEIFKYFRNNYFKNENEFYDAFYKYLNTDLKKFFLKNKNKMNKKKKFFPFYSLQDIKFRLVRDNFLSKKKYINIMKKMMKDKKFNYLKVNNRIFFSKKDLVRLNKLGHIVGIHSHSHPTVINNLSYRSQKYEYSKCLQIVSKILKSSKSKIYSMSHPCGNFNKNTLKILDKLDLKLGFKNNMEINENKKIKNALYNKFLINRENHTNITRMMK